MKVFKESEITPTIEKKNAWITWDISKKGLINSLYVYDIIELKEKISKKEVMYSSLQMYAKSFDIGYCNLDWEKWSLSDVLLKLFYQYGFESKIDQLIALKNLAKIIEFHDSLKRYIIT